MDIGRWIFDFGGKNTTFIKAQRNRFLQKQNCILRFFPINDEKKFVLLHPNEEKNHNIPITPTLHGCFRPSSDSRVDGRGG
jgi:hypothetical protein